LSTTTEPDRAADSAEEVSRRLRVAFVGKGGAGKSSIAGTLARLLAARGEPVLCLDSDPLPGLATSVGLPSSDAGLPDEVVEEVPEEERPPPFRLAEGLTPGEAARRYADTGPDGLRFLQFGKTRGHAAPLRRSQFGFRLITRGVHHIPWHVIGDLPAGTRQPFFGWADYAHLVLVVAEPVTSSMLSAKRLARLGEGLDAPAIAGVANKTRRDDDAELVAERSGLPVSTSVPLDPELREAEQRGVALVDYAPGSPTVQAIGSLLNRLLDYGSEP
jgi:CO dehydrogenase maturation factor